MANDVVCINSDIINNVKAMETRAVLTQVQAYGDLLSKKFNENQYRMVCSSMDNIINECHDVLEHTSLMDKNYYIISMYTKQAEKISFAFATLSKIA